LSTPRARCRIRTTRRARSAEVGVPASTLRVGATENRLHETEHRPFQSRGVCAPRCRRPGPIPGARRRTPWKGAPQPVGLSTPCPRRRSPTTGPRAIEARWGGGESVDNPLEDLGRWPFAAFATRTARSAPRCPVILAESVQYSVAIDRRVDLPPVTVSLCKLALMGATLAVARLRERTAPVPRTRAGAHPYAKV